jgi:sugar lactone lactonase YvrE
MAHTAEHSYLIKSKLHKALAEGVYRDIASGSSSYYYFLGKTLAWNIDDVPPYPIDSYAYERLVRSEIITMKEIKSSDVSFVVRKIDWTSGDTYDMYDDEYSGEILGLDLINGGSGYNFVPTITVTGGGGSGALFNAIIDIESGKIIGVDLVSKGSGYVTAPTVTVTGGGGVDGQLEAVLNIAPSGATVLEDCNFYVLTDDFNVYKCLDNNNNSPSTVKPTGTQVEPITLIDGYIWKYMYNIPIGLRNKFLTGDQIPVVSALTNQFYNSGSLDAISILNSGAGYASANINVQGDGYRESDPSFLQSVLVSDGGSNYSSPTVTISDPFTSTSPFLAGGQVYIGQKISNANKDFYEVVVPGSLGGVEPTHKFGTVQSDSINAGVAWSSGLTVPVNQKIYVSGRFYNVTIAGTLGSTPPIHTSGTAVDGTATLLYVSAPPVGTASLKYIGTTAKATVTKNMSDEIESINLIGGVREITLTTGGSGYTSTPRIVISGGSGSGATAVARMNNDSVLYAVVTNSGDNYTSTPTVSFGTQWASLAEVQLFDQIYNVNSLYTVTSVSQPLLVENSYFVNKSISVNARDTSPTGLFFSSDGTKLFVAGDTGNNVVAYNLTTAWDITTATFVNESGVSTETSPTGIFFSADGLKMYIVGSLNDFVYQYNLSNPWTLPATLPTPTTFSVADQDSVPVGISFNDIGTTMYIVGATSDAVYEYNLSSAWDITSATLSTSFNISTESTTPTDIAFSSDGKNMLILDSGADVIYQYNLSVPWDIDSSVYSNSFSVAAQEGTPSGLYLQTNRNYLYVIGTGTNTVYQYQIPQRSKLGNVPPTHPSGSQTNGEVTLTYVGQPASGEVITRYGAGYSVAPEITITDSTGSDAEFIVLMAPSEAVVLPIIDNGQITGVTVVDGGIGYTAADIEVISGTGNGAKLLADLNLGNIQSLQANNEILTVAGTIDAIKIVSGGYGYGSASVSIVGDGTGATATADVDLSTGKISKINITSRGQNYTFAHAVIYGNGTGATARAIISPYGGHGKNAPEELFARTLVFYSNISSDLNQGLQVDNDYRQFGIIKNPRAYGNSRYFDATIGSACFVVETDVNLSFFAKDMDLTTTRGMAWTPSTVYVQGQQIYNAEQLYTVTLGGISSSTPPIHTTGNAENGTAVLQYIGNPIRRYRIVSLSATSVLLQSLDNDVPTINDTFSNANSNSFKPKTVGFPTIDKYSGQLMYIDNKQGFTPSADETVILRTVIKF